VGPNLISPLQVGLGAVLVLVNACISVYLDLGLEVALAIATVRCVTPRTQWKACVAVVALRSHSAAAPACWSAWEEASNGMWTILNATLHWCASDKIYLHQLFSHDL